MMDMCRYMKNGHAVESFTSRPHAVQLRKFEALGELFRGRVPKKLWDRYARALDEVQEACVLERTGVSGKATSAGFRFFPLAGQRRFRARSAGNSRYELPTARRTQDFCSARARPRVSHSTTVRDCSRMYCAR